MLIYVCAKSFEEGFSSRVSISKEKYLMTEDIREVGV